MSSEDVHQPTFSLHNREADYPRDRLHNLGRSADIRIHDEVDELGSISDREDGLRKGLRKFPLDDAIVVAYHRRREKAGRRTECPPTEKVWLL